MEAPYRLFNARMGILYFYLISLSQLLVISMRYMLSDITIDINNNFFSMLESYLHLFSNIIQVISK